MLADKMTYGVIVVVLAGLLLVNPPILFSQESQDPNLLQTIEVSGANLIAWNPKNNWIAHFKYTNRQNYISIFDAMTLDIIADIPGNGARSVAWSPDGTQIAVVAINPQRNAFDLTIWSITTSEDTSIVQRVNSFEIGWVASRPSEQVSIDWHPHDPIIALGTSYGLFLIELGVENIEHIKSAGFGIIYVKWSPNGEKLAFGWLDVMDYLTREIIISLAVEEFPGLDDRLLRPIPPDQQTQFLSWSPDSKAIAFFYTADDIRGIYILDIESKSILSNVIIDPRERVQAIAWSPNGSMIATVGGEPFCVDECNDAIRIWKSETLELLYEINTHTDIITTVSWSSDSRMLATGSQDNTIRVWEIPDG